MADSALNAPLYRSRIRTTIYGARLGLDDDGMLVGPPALKGNVQSISTTVPTTVPSHGYVRVATSGSSQGPTQHNLSAPMPGIEVTFSLVSTSTGSCQFLSTPAGAAIYAASLGTTVGVLNLLGPAGSVTLVGLTTAAWAVKSHSGYATTALGAQYSHTTST